MQKNGFEVIVCKGLLIYVINWSRNFENCWNINTTETCLKLKLLILMRFENFLMIEYYTERMTKDWNQERYTVRNYHNLFYFCLLSSKILVLQLHCCKSKANQLPRKMNTQLMAEKKRKTMQQRKLTSNSWRKNRITLQWQKNIAYYLWRKKITQCKSKLNYDLLLTQVPKNECYNVYLGIRKKHNWIVLCML